MAVLWMSSGSLHHVTGVFIKDAHLASFPQLINNFNFNYNHEH